MVPLPGQPPEDGQLSEREATLPDPRHTPQNPPPSNRLGEGEVSGRTRDNVENGVSSTNINAVCIAQVIAHAIPATKTIFDDKLRVAQDHLYIELRKVWMIVTEKLCGV